MFQLPDSIGLVAAVALGIVAFLVSRSVTNYLRGRRAQKDEAARRATESRQVRRARERKRP